MKSQKYALAYFTVLIAATLFLLGCGGDKTTSPSTDSSAAQAVSSGTVLSSGVIPLSSGVTGSSGTVQSSGASSAVVVTSSSKGASSAVISSSTTITSSTTVLSSSSKGTSSAVVSSSAKVSSSTTVSSSSTVVASSSSFYPFNNNYSYGTFTDTRDGKVYKTLKINTYTWMAQNLDYGTQVSGMAATGNQYNDAVVEKYCYNDDAANCVKYGGLYQWAEAMGLPAVCDSTLCAGQVAAQQQGVCPVGWHVSTYAEWGDLVGYLPVSGEGTELKCDLYWDPSGRIASNSTGFSALGGGYRHNTGGYTDLTKMGLFWYAEKAALTGNVTFLTYQLTGITFSNDKKLAGESVRCVQNYV